MLKHIMIALLLVIPMTAGCSDNPSPQKATKGTGVEQGVRKDTSAQSQQIEVDEYPQPLHQVMPEFPESVKKEKREGTVWVNVLVGKDGNVKEAKVMNSQNGSPDMEKSALTAAKQWTFKPATKDKKPVEFWATIPFRYRLK